MNANGELVEKAYYLPWGGERGDTSITSTDYGYTGQMKEGDIYYYGARWYDPSIGRFMQADTIVPLNVQGTQAFDRYAYVNNNPLRYTDPSGHYYQECGDDNYGRCGTIAPPSVGSGLPSSYSTYNIMVCGWGSEASCGQGYGTPLYPYYDWPGDNYFFKALNIPGDKYNAMKEILALLDGLTGGAQLYLSGHSAGADTVLLLLDAIMGNGNYANIEILGVVLLDPSLTAGGGPIGGPDYTTLGSLAPMLGIALAKGIPTYVGVTDSYEATSRVRDYIGYGIFPTSQYPNYSYNSPALVDMTTYMSHDDLGTSVYYALEAWMFIGGIR